MRKSICIILSMISFLSYGQQQGSIWYFGENAGLDFNYNPPMVLSDGKIKSGNTNPPDHGNRIFFEYRIYYYAFVLPICPPVYAKFPINPLFTTLSIINSEPWPDNTEK